MRRSISRASPLIIDSLQQKMDSSKPQFRPPSSRFTHTRSNLWIAVAAASSLAVFFYFFVLARGNRQYLRFGKRGFGIIIDGGSTGTRIHVFESSIDGGGGRVKETASMKVNPGLSSFENYPEGSGRSLVDLVEFGKGKVPKEVWEETEIRLMATAGLRRLDVGVQDRILESCRQVLRSSGFKFRDDWASVITGSDEGIYAWVSANYALGTLGGDPQQTTGIIELGGASAQVTFVSSELLPPEFSHTLKFGELTYNLYSHSFLHFGQNVAYDSLHKSIISSDLKLSVESVQEEIFIDPCTPRGYSYGMDSLKPSAGYLPTIHSRGNFSECRFAALTLLQKGKDKCSYQHCHLGSSFVPKLQGKFLATENFFYTSKFFGLAPTAILSDLMLAGQQFCEEDWSKIKRKYHNLDEEDLLRYCFSSAYIVALLHDSLGIPLNDERMEFTNQVGDISLDWALGAFILQKTGDSEFERPDWFANIVNEDSSTFLSLFIVSFVLIFTAWSVSKWRKPQVKTIYDLEKGRYIVTRVTR